MSTRMATTAAVCLLAAQAIHAQPASTPAAQNPAAIDTFEVEGGYDFRFASGAEDEDYYRISYLGSLIRSEGTPFKYAQGLDLTAPALSTGAGDRNALALRYEKGTTTVGSELLEAEGVKPIPLRGLETLHLRGTALVGADLQTNMIQAAVGLESPPLRIPGFQRTAASNWLVFGANGQRQENTDSASQDANFGLLTYRAFLGQAFGWRKSADVEQTAAKLVQALLEQAPDLDKAREAAAKIEAIPANQRTKLQQLFLDTVGDTTSGADWQKTVRDIAFGTADAITDQPTLSVYIEASGWYEFAGSTHDDKLKSLVTATIDYWPLPRTDAFFLRARYEHGYERAAPDTKKDHLLVSVAVRF
jgi:hypothetical protein